MAPNPPEPSVSAVLAEYLAAWDAGTPPPPLPHDPRLCQLIQDAHTIWQTLDLLPAPPVGGQLPSTIGRFRVECELGRGGFGVVYRAHDPQMNRLVALKQPLLAAFLLPDAKQRFLREAQLTAPLDHPNVVPIYEAGETPTGLYLAAAYVPGPSLAAWLTQHPEPLPPRTVAAMIAELADGVQHAHQHGVLHRDLKPGNILLHPRTDTPTQLADYTPRIADFGLGRLLATDRSAPVSQLMGTTAYMAPEQLAGPAQGVDGRVDIWALGVLLYELLTGQRPFTGEHPASVVHDITMRDPVRLRLRNRTIPADLEAVCLKCLAKDPARRYASADALATDLRHFLAGRPTVARPLTWTQAAWRWGAQHPLLLVSATLAFVLLVLGPMFLVRYFDVQQLLRATEQTEAATRRLAYERARALRVQNIRQRLSEQPPGWTAANWRDFQQLAPADMNPDEDFALRSEAVATLAASEWGTPQRLLPDVLTESIAFTQDGRFFAIGSNQVSVNGLGSVHLFRTATLAEERVWRHPSKPVPMINGKSGPDGTRALRFTADDQALFQGTRSGWLWRYDLGRDVAEPSLAVSAHDGQISRLATTATRLYTLGADNHVKGWPTVGSQIEPLAQTRLPHLPSVGSNRSLHAFDHQVLVTMGDNVHWLDPTTLALDDPKTADGTVLPDHARIATIASESSSASATEMLLGVGPDVWLWDLRHRLATTRLAGLRDPQLGGAIPHDPQLAADGQWGAAVTDAEVIVWDMTLAQLHVRLPVPPLAGIARRLALSPDGQRLVAGGKPTLVWQRAPSTIYQTCAVQGLPLLRFVMANDGTLVTYGTGLSRTDYAGSTVRLYPPQGPARVLHTNIDKYHCEDMAIAPDGRRLLSMSDVEEVRCVELPNATPLWQATCERLAQVGQAHAFTPDGKHVWAARGTKMERYDALTGTRDRVIEAPRFGRGIHQVWALAVSTRYLLAVNRDGMVDGYDATTGERLYSCDLGVSGGLSMTIAPDERFALVGTLDGRVVMLDVASGTVQHTLTKHVGHVTTVALDSTGTLMASGGVDGRLLLWQWGNDTWQPLLAFPTGKRAVTQVHFTRTGELYVLLAGAHGLQRYDLERLRTRLQEVHLGW